MKSTRILAAMFLLCVATGCTSLDVMTDTSGNGATENNNGTYVGNYADDPTIKMLEEGSKGG